MKKITIILCSVGVILSFWYYYSAIEFQKFIINKCQGYKLNWGDFIDCNGAITITDGWDQHYLSIQDHVHKYEIAHIFNEEKYFLEGKKMYLINQEFIENSSSRNNKTTYYQELFQNGEINKKSYKTISDIPRFFIIDTISGEVIAYTKISDMPKEQQSYFDKMNK